MKVFSSLLILLIFTSLGYSQDFTIENGSIQACEGSFFDSGGADGNYSANENFVFTICPDDPDLKSVISFTEFIITNNNDFLTIYDGDDPDNDPELVTLTGDEVSAGEDALVFTASDDNPTGCLTFVFDSDFSFENSGWAAEISCREPCPDVEADIVSISPSVQVEDDLYRVCQDEVITFVGDGVFSNDNGEPAIYTWTLNGQEFEGQTITNTFGGPDFVEVVLTVDYEFCPESNDFKTVFLQVGTEPDFTGTEASVNEVCEGDPFQLIGEAQTVEFEQECTPPVSGQTFLPDGNGVSYETCITVECFADSQVVQSTSDLVDVFANIEHSYTGDLDISITSPNGTEVFLFTQSGGGNFFGEPIDNDADLSPGIGYTYSWTESAAQTMADALPGFGQSLPAGSYLPVGNFNNFIGDSLNGQWCITVTDNIGSDNGYIFEWGLNFDPNIVPPDAQFEPQIVDSYWVGFEGQGDIIDISEDEAGQYCYTYVIEDDFDCMHEEVVCVNVLENPEIQNLNDIILCVPDETTIPEFDLTENELAALGDQDPDLFQVSFHNSEADAESGTPEINSPEAFIPPSLPYTVFIRIEDENGQCYEIGDFLLDTVTLDDDAELDNLEQCTEAGEEFTEFDLTQNDTNALGALDSSDFAVNYFTSEQDAIDGDNSIPNPESYTNTSNPQTIFVKVSSLDPEEELCFVIYTFTIEAFPTPEVVNTVDLDQCGDFTFTQSFDLTQNDSEVYG
ncbi:proprotein convertase P-domain-containing protein, partial [Psychroflexus aestuariivivens]|uniref:proprotein convertase P-domain-containing protein n=1 Tax=Psychroflexus aestuariivivens TaxID=1795040 RepID=UPI0018655BE6